MVTKTEGSRLVGGGDSINAGIERRGCMEDSG